MLASLFHMPECDWGSGFRRARFEPADPLLGIVCAGQFQVLANAVHIGLVCGRQGIQIEELDIIAAGVVITADEPGIVWNVDAALPQTQPDFGRFAMAAKSRALGPPRRPPQAPQSCADSCGLLRLVDPWPSTTTMRAKPQTSPAGRKRSPLVRFFPQVQSRSTDRSRRRATE